MHPSRTEHARAFPPAWLVWGAAAAFYFVALFHRMSLGVAALDAEHRYGVDAGLLGVFSAVQLGLYMVMQIPAGLAADRIGPRRTLALGLALMATGEAVFALGSTLPAAIAGRGLIGIGDAFIFLNVLRLAQSWYPASRYGLLATLAGLAGAAGQVFTTVPLGAALAGPGWTPTFLGVAVLTLVMTIVCLLVVRDAPAGADRPAAHDHEGLAATLRAAWHTPATRHAMALHAVLMGTFVSVTALWGFPFLVRSQGVAPGSARTLLMCGVVAFGLGGPVLGLIVARHPVRRTAILRAVAGVVVATWTACLATGAAPGWLLATTILVTGIGGAAGLLAFDIARAANPAHRGGAVSGIVNVGGFGLAVSAQLAIGAALRITGGDLGRALWPMVVLGALALATATRLSRRTPGVHHHEAAVLAVATERAG